MTRIQEAKSNLDTYVVALVLKTEEFSAAKLRYLEQRLVDAALELNATSPF